PRPPAILPRMTSRDSAASEITPEVLLRAYACGIFPMAESAGDPTLFWVEPEMRGVIPLDGFRIASRLARTVRADTFSVTVATPFTGGVPRLAAGPHRARGYLQRDRRYRLQGGHRGLRGAAAGPRRHLDQQAYPRSLCRTLRARALPQRRGLAGWRPRRRSLWGEPRARLLR